MLDVLREYLHGIPAGHLAALPEDCPVRPITSIDDVSELALTLARCELCAKDGSTPLLQEMALVFSSAQTRIRQLRSRSP